MPVALRIHCQRPAAAGLAAEESGAEGDSAAEDLQKKPAGADNKGAWDPTCVSWSEKEGYAQVKVDDLKFTLQRTSEDMCRHTGLPTNAPGFRFLLIPRLCKMRRPMRSSSKILTSEAALAVLPGALLWCRHGEVNKLRRCPLVTLCPPSVSRHS